MEKLKSFIIKIAKQFGFEYVKTSPNASPIDVEFRMNYSMDDLTTDLNWLKQNKADEVFIVLKPLLPMNDVFNEIDIPDNIKYIDPMFDTLFFIYYKQKIKVSTKCIITKCPEKLRIDIHNNNGSLHLSV